VHNVLFLNHAHAHALALEKQKDSLGTKAQGFASALTAWPTSIAGIHGAKARRS
jgi:hypothetical protein